LAHWGIGLGAGQQPAGYRHARKKKCQQEAAHGNGSEQRQHAGNIKLWQFSNAPEDGYQQKKTKGQRRCGENLERVLLEVVNKPGSKRREWASGTWENGDGHDRLV
uniref:H15 domain-containing protein n=1 Tax=Brugia timori TaxID=42155 RepID=A0A0R3QA04_9BILA